jgi:DNA-binding GntR family transcriptional regulator
LKTSEAYDAIKDLLLTHSLVAGQKIVYRDLEEKLGMSRTPIISGLARLEQEGFVVSKENRGFYVRETSAKEVEEIFDIREKLEEVAVDFAFKNLEDADIVLLQRRLVAYKKYSAPIYDRSRLDLDTDFHMQIAKMGGKPYFTELIQRFYENIYFRLDIAILTPYIEKFRKEHEKIFDAIKARDLKGTKSLLRSHTRAAKELVLKQFRR